MTWRSVDEEELEESGREKLERARAAQKDLGKTLKQHLTSAVSEKSFAGAVDFCQAEAPAIAEGISDEHGVSVGRTSHRLRNQGNAPPAWAEKAVERRKAREYVYRGPEGELGYLRPIELKGLCVSCHGPKEKLAPGVPEKLKTHYPNDEATGFEVGDLRGWFWVEVPPEAS